jgi:hypothetical protein
MVAYGTQVLTAAVTTGPLAPSGTASPVVAVTETVTSGGALSAIESITAAAACDKCLSASVAGDTNSRFNLDSNGAMKWGTGAAGTDMTLSRVGVGTLRAAGTFQVTGGALDVTQAGQGVKVAEGANAKQGTFVLAGAATTVVANTSVTANSRILLTCQALGTVATPSALAVSAVSAGVSFTVTPSQSTDTSTIAYEIFEPG